MCLRLTGVEKRTNQAEICNALGYDRTTVSQLVCRDQAGWF
jgi:hypothetical protein